MEIKWKASKSHGNIITQTMEWPKKYWPQTVFGGSEQNVYRRSWLSTLDTEIRPLDIWTFIGLDRGDIVEADVEVYTEKGIPLVLRSLHKEVSGIFDAWQHNCLPYLEPIRIIRVVATCRVNGRNVFGRNVLLHKRLEARFHLGVIIIGGA